MTRGVVSIEVSSLGMRSIRFDFRHNRRLEYGLDRKVARHYIGVIWAPWHLNYRLFLLQFVHVNDEENHHVDPLWVEFTGDRSISHTKGQ